MGYKQQKVIIPGAQDEVVAYMMAFLAGYDANIKIWHLLLENENFGQNRIVAVYSPQSVRSDPADYPYLFPPDIEVRSTSKDEFLIAFDERMDSKLFDRLPAMVQEQMARLQNASPIAVNSAR